MSTVLTEAVTADALVKIAHEQVAAFNSGDWERLQAGLAADSRYEELGTAPRGSGRRRPPPSSSPSPATRSKTAATTSTR